MQGKEQAMRKRVMRMRLRPQRKTVQEPEQAAARDAYAQVVGKAVGLECVAELQFHPVRRWRFDYAIPAAKVAIEIDGGVWAYGRHNRAAGYIGDMEKLNEAARLGWRVLRYTTEDKWKTATLVQIREACAYIENN